MKSCTNTSISTLYKGIKVSALILFTCNSIPSGNSNTILITARFHCLHYGRFCYCGFCNKHPGNCYRRYPRKCPYIGSLPWIHFPPETLDTDGLNVYSSALYTAPISFFPSVILSIQYPALANNTVFSMPVRC